MILFVRKCWTLLHVGLVVLRIRLSLRVKTLPRVLDQLSSLCMAAEPDDSAIKRLVGYVDCWLRWFPYNTKGNCFPRSLAIYGFARQLGYPVVFHCGVRKGASNLDGHAWLTLGSYAFYEPGKQWRDFTVTFSYPPDPARDVNQTAVL
jgi:hypothetical protein